MTQTQTRLDRLARDRTRERSRVLRSAAVVAAALAVLVVVPFGQTPAPDPDEVTQRLVTAQREREAATVQAEVAPEVEAAVAEPVAQIVDLTEAPDLFLPLGRVTIPKIGVDMPIRNGVHERILEEGVGQWPGTEAGQTVLSGHRTTYLHPFGDLDLLAPDDEVILTMGGGAPQTYRVFETQIVPEADYVDVVLAGTPEPGDTTVTMYACHPKGQRTHRIVVRARAV